jgi:copper resistance protein B
MKMPLCAASCVAALLLATELHAQPLHPATDREDPVHAGHPGHAGPTMPAVDSREAEPSGAPGQSRRPAAPDHSAHPGHGSHGDRTGLPQPAGADPGQAVHAAGAATREPVPAPTDADRAAAFPALAHGHSHGHGLHSLVRFNRMEAWDADGRGGQAWEGKAWLGGDLQRLWLRSDGERRHGQLESADLELLYGRGLTAWWDVLAGVRHDFAPGRSRDWLAVGVQGMAPYKFDVAATAYLGPGGQSAFKAEVEYELLLGPRLVLQPLLEVELHGRGDSTRHVGAGLSTAEAGLRLRYELHRRFAPYVGLVHERSFGRTADLRTGQGEPVRDTRWVAGVRFWF